jgi:hypothetical protein
MEHRTGGAVFGIGLIAAWRARLLENGLASAKPRHQRTWIVARGRLEPAY